MRYSEGADPIMRAGDEDPDTPEARLLRRIARAKKWMPAYDSLPPDFRKLLREAFYENHDPTEFACFLRSRYNRPEPMMEQVRLQDVKKLLAAPMEQLARGNSRAEETPLQRAMTTDKRLALMQEKARQDAKARADRLMTYGVVEAAPPEPEALPPSLLRRLFG